MSKALIKGQKLKSAKTITYLFSKGKVIRKMPFVLYYATEDAAHSSYEFGFGAAKKKMPKAKDRNRMKRLMREAVRNEQGTISEILDEQNKKMALMLIFSGDKLVLWDECLEKIKLILVRLNKEVNNTRL